MSIFSFFKKDKIENENKTKPFHENLSASQRLDWFQRTRPWHAMPKSAISALESHIGSNPMFELFVVSSTQNGLVPEYLKVLKEEDSEEVIRAKIGQILFAVGAKASASVGNIMQTGKPTQKKLAKFYETALNCLESATLVEPMQIDAYVQLAGLRAMFGKKDDALVFVKQGLAAVDSLLSKDIPFHKSSIPSIRKSSEHLQKTKTMLLALHRDFS